MTDNTHGQVPAIQRYKIGYHCDEWGMRSSTPSGIPDHAGAWVRYEDHVAALVEAQQPTTHVPNPAEIEHVAGDVSKNGPESNMAQQPAPSAAAAKQSAACDKAPAGWLCIRQHGHDSPCAAEPTLSARSDEWIEGYAAGVRDGRADALRAPQPSPTPQADSVLEDAARLDWLALAGPTSICLVIDRPHDGEVEVATDDVTGYGKTLREAIDAAMNKGGA